jgi:hypothetical protein
MGSTILRIEELGQRHSAVMSTGLGSVAKSFSLSDNLQIFVIGRIDD